MINIRGGVFAKKILGLVALQVAMLLGWRTYDVFQPEILRSLHARDLAPLLLLCQGLFAIFLEPIMGNFSDKTLSRRGSRVLSVAVGVIIAGLIFVASSLVLQSGSRSASKQFVPILMVAWLAAMSSFRSPATALLYRYVSTQTLPIAVSVLVMVNGIMGALGVYINRVLLSVGPSASFIFAGVILVLSVLILRYVSQEDKAPPQDGPLPAVNRANIAWIWSMGLGAGFILCVLLYTTAGYLSSQLAMSSESLNSIILLLSALSCIPALLVAMTIGMKKTFLSSIVLLVILLCVLLLQLPVPGWSLVGAFGVLLGLALNTMFPLVFGFVPEERAGLATGFLSSGLGAAFLGFTILDKTSKISASGGMLILLVACLLVLFSTSRLKEG